ncbi:Phosphoacetylglucosamine mutase [Armadillidium vulgare]|nr:Phosphoacetylglucosamine mutase [Armadillidium vulgare]
MITASHNPVEDNGVKLIDPFGEMLAVDWESHATRLANVPEDKIGEVLQSIINSNSIDMSQKAIVFVGRDTRPSSTRFQEAVERGVTLMDGEVKDFGLVSTPIVHFVVTCFNDGGEYGEPTEEGYFEKLAAAFVNLRTEGSSKGSYIPEILFDGANGIGALKMVKLLKYLKGTLKAQIFNQGDGELNHLCGADYVKSNQRSPNGVPSPSDLRCVSVDGDADRIIYSYYDEENKFHMLDGDKIATLVAGYIKNLVEKAGVQLNLGLVQTAYANGASTEYINKQLGIPVACACTGVKHLHHAALEFDIGVYFEANGHGTVLFSKNARNAIKTAAGNGSSSAIELLNVMSLINETVGDALSDMLLVETVLLANGWSAKEWDEAYTDLPNRLTKVTVNDRSVITTTNAERTCVTPKGLQEVIDSFVSNYPKGRAFVRPSGTEDIVRVYAEAATEEDVRKLSNEIALAVYDHAGGLGQRPTL